MDGEWNRQIGEAIRAIVDLHDDCIRLFHDLDKALPEYKSVYGNVVTLNLGSSMARRAYLAEGLLRLYVRDEKPEQILGVNICFYDPADQSLVEPLFVVANTQYVGGSPDQQEKMKFGWDPWSLFWTKDVKKDFGVAYTVESFPKRPTIQRSVVVGVPLESVRNLQSALDLIESVGRP